MEIWPRSAPPFIHIFYENEKCPTRGDESKTKSSMKKWVALVTVTPHPIRGGRQAHSKKKGLEVLSQIPSRPVPLFIHIFSENEKCPTRGKDSETKSSMKKGVAPVSVTSHMNRGGRQAHSKIKGIKVLSHNFPRSVPLFINIWHGNNKCPARGNESKTKSSMDIWVAVIPLYGIRYNNISTVQQLGHYNKIGAEIGWVLYEHDLSVLSRTQARIVRRILDFPSFPSKYPLYY